VDLSPTDDDALLFERITSFARARLGRDVVARDREHRFSHEDWRASGEVGLLGLCLPTRYGGLGLGAVTTAGAMAALGRACPDMGLVFSVAAHQLACALPIALHAREELQAEVLPPLACGRHIGANAITEAEAGSDVFALATTAKRDGNEWVLDGAKSFVTNAPVADVFVVYASTDRSAGSLGVTAFLVPRRAPGLVVGESFAKSGLTTSPVAGIYLESCRVPASAVIGGEGQGARVFADAMVWERSCLFAGYVGAMDRQLDETIAFAKERRQFRKPLAKHQAIAHRIVGMKLRLESARLLVQRACWLLDRGSDATLAASLAKLAVSEAAMCSALDAVHIRGGAGIMTEMGVERAVRDALPATIFSGTSEIQRDLVARGLGL
jgi:alkylation response protein AidB-like acyl-CoA dehydrogenase